MKCIEEELLKLEICHKWWNAWDAYHKLFILNAYHKLKLGMIVSSDRKYAFNHMKLFVIRLLVLLYLKYYV